MFVDLLEESDIGFDRNDLIEQLYAAAEKLKAFNNAEIKLGTKHSINLQLGTDSFVVDYNTLC